MEKLIRLMKTSFLVLLLVIGNAKGQGTVDDTAKVELGIEQAPVVFKNLKNSNLNFENVDVKDFLSLKKWIEVTDEKSRYPDWEKVIKERDHKEIIGHFFQCSGYCRIDRAESFFNAKFRTNLYEGDEVSTDKDSYAWVLLMDGTLVRLAPDSSVTLNEYNIGIEENFIMARINAGNVLWISRRELTYKESNATETDQLFFPLSYYDAEAIREEKKFDENNILNYLEPSMTNTNQYIRLNKLIEKNKGMTRGKKTYTILILPNITLMGYAPQVEMISLLGGKSYVKQRTNAELNYVETEAVELEYQLRGFENKETAVLKEGVWFEVEEKGKKISEDESPALRVVGEFVTKRIPSILVAREMLLSEYSEVSFRENYDKKALALNDGYRLWGKLKSSDEKKDDLELRLSFLKEYYRRAETTNLLVSERFRRKLQERGDKTKTTEYGSYFFSKAIEKYFDYVEYSDEKLDKDELNSTKKKLWKMMHGLR